MDAAQNSAINNESVSNSATDTNEPAVATAVPAWPRFDFHLSLSAIERLRPGALFAALAAPAPAPEPEPAPESEVASGDLPQVGDTPQVDDDVPPPLRLDSDSDSDSDASEASDSDAHSDAGSLPSLRTVSVSSEEEDASSSDADSDEWDDEEARPVNGGDWDEREARELVDDFRRGLEAMGSAVQSAALLEDEPDDSEWEYEDTDYLDEDLASQGGEATMRSIDLLEWLMSPQRLAADNDPQRAEVLVAGLEAVSDELVRRYEKLRGGEGDAAEGCAICRDDYLIPHECDPADFWKLSERELTTAHFAMLPFHPSPHQILAFPCPGRHLFHLSCLAPWLARKTTCPTCRFDIDPHSLTLRQSGTISLYAAGMGMWKPPAVSGLEEWLAEEERYKEEGHRPECAHTPAPEPFTQDRSESTVTPENDDDLRPATFMRALATLTHAETSGGSGRSRSLFRFPRGGHPNHPTALRHAAHAAGRHVSPSSPRRPRGHVGASAPPRSVRDVADSIVARIVLLDRARASASTHLHDHEHEHEHEYADPPPPPFQDLAPSDEGASDDELPALVE